MKSGVLRSRQSFKQVVLLKPAYRNSHYGDLWLPAGLAYISCALERVGIEHFVVDMGLAYSFESLKDIICKCRVDLLGVSMMTFGHRHIYVLLEDIKRDFPELCIVAGGPHVSTLREEVLRECQAVDFGVVLEGEETMVELCQGHKPYSEIKGLIYRDKGDIMFVGERPFIQNLDAIGFPNYSRFEIEKYGQDLIVNIVTSRGCPYKCIYCPVEKAIGRQFRMRSAKSVGEELEFLYKRKWRNIGIADDNFTLQQKRVIDICNEIDSRGLTGLKMSLANGIRADCVDRLLLVRMREVGFYYVAFGVEAGNNRILELIGKGERIEVIERAISDACELGYQVTLFFLLGSPGETELDLQDSLDLALRYSVYDVRFYNIIPFPGTELFNWVKDNNYLLASPESYLSDASHWVNQPLFETPELSRKVRMRLYRELNRKAYLHTLPVKRKVHLKSVSEKFRRYGVPRWLSNKLARMYFSRPMQMFLFSKAGVPLKRVFS